MICDVKVRFMMLKLYKFFLLFFAILFDLSGESFLIKLLFLILSFVSTLESNSKNSYLRVLRFHFVHI